MKKILKKMLVVLVAFAITFTAVAPAMTVEVKADTRDLNKWKLMKTKQEYNAVNDTLIKLKDLQEQYKLETKKTAKMLSEARVRGLKPVIKYCEKRLKAIRKLQDEIIKKMTKMKNRKRELEKIIKELEKLLR